MDFWNTITGWGKNAWQAVLNVGSGTATVFGSLWRFTFAGINGFIHILTHPLADVENSTAFWAGLATGNITAAINAFKRLEGYGPKKWVAPVKNKLQRQITWVYGVTMSNIHRLYRLIMREVATLREWVMDLIQKERKARRKADAREHAYAHQQAKWALQTANREAASGYEATRSGRVAVVTKLLDAIVVRDPVVKDLVGKIVTALLDLASVEDPLARLFAGFVITHIIDALGIDKAMGEAAQALLAPLLGDPHPANLHDVIKDLSGRVGALEGQWATFMADGGPQILQAGKDWRDLTSLPVDAALLAFGVAGVADPQGVARDLADATRAAGTSTISTLAGILSGKG